MPEIMEINKEERWLTVSCSHSSDIVKLTAEEYDNICKLYGGHYGFDWYMFNNRSIKFFKDNQWNIVGR